MNVQYLLQWASFGSFNIFRADFGSLHPDVLNNIVVVFTVRLYGLLIVIRKYVYLGERPYMNKIWNV